MLQRIIIDILLVIGLFTLPWWIFWFIGLFFVFKYESFYEFMFLGVLADGMYAVSDMFLFSEIIFSLSSILIFVIIAKIKSSIIAYR